jgi:hypothetical protein
MANEITKTAKIVIDNTTDDDTWNPGTDQITQTGVGREAGIQIIGFAAEEVVTVNADVTTLGVFGFKNLDATNFVDIGPESAGAMVPMIRLKPGESCEGRFKPGIVIRAQADTGLVKLKKWINQD